MTAPLHIPGATTQGQFVLRDVWKASELAVMQSTTHSTGYPTLDQELPNSGWPRSTLVELLVQQHGVGEVQLLKPALAKLSGKRRIALIQPPYLPHSMTCRAWHINDRNMLWLRPGSSADALWAAEQILRNGSCGAVILWQTHVRSEVLRRLHLAAQSAETWLWLLRPISAAVDASPASLRMALRPAWGGVSVDIIKRRGPHCEAPIFIPLMDMPAGRQHPDTRHETDVKRIPSPVAAGSVAPVLV